MDLSLSLAALTVLSPLILILALVSAVAMRDNPFFTQKRPGRTKKDGSPRIFSLIKFRTMSNARDKNGELLPDEKRLSRYGRILRRTSLARVIIGTTLKTQYLQGFLRTAI